jgi:small subunit ribosomal protein S6
LETVAKRLYEGMFLVDSAQAAADWEGTVGVIENILKRADADVVALRKWGERRLAYDVDHKSRGTYVLSYFKADGRRVAGIEKDVQLSENVMRVLILGTEKRPPEVIEVDITGVPKGEEAGETAASTKDSGPTGAEAAAEKVSPEAPSKDDDARSDGATSDDGSGAQTDEAEAGPALEAAPETVSDEPEKSAE